MFQPTSLLLYYFVLKAYGLLNRSLSLSTNLAARSPAAGKLRAGLKVVFCSPLFKQTLKVWLVHTVEKVLCYLVGLGPMFPLFFSRGLLDGKNLCF